MPARGGPEEQLGPRLRSPPRRAGIRRAGPDYLIGASHIGAGHAPRVPVDARCQRARSSHPRLTAYRLGDWYPLENKERCPRTSAIDSAEVGPERRLSITTPPPQTVGPTPGSSSSGRGPRRSQNRSYIRSRSGRSSVRMTKVGGCVQRMMLWAKYEWLTMRSVA